jgi:pimeloyl-ACP methyl ester carboxylesterase
MNEDPLFRFVRGVLEAVRKPWETINDAIERLSGGGPHPAEPPAAMRPVIGKMPEGVPTAALRAEPKLPRPPAWPFPESFPRTCGTGRLDAGAVFWTDFLYDDHGALGVPVGFGPIAFSPSLGTYRYPEGRARGNGADVFRVAIGLDPTSSWWRVDWNTLVEPTVPIAAFALDVDSQTPGAAEWPAGAGIRSPGVDHVLLVSGTGAWLIDALTGARQSVVDAGGEHQVDMPARSFVVRLPRAVLDPVGRWRVRLAAGRADREGQAFAPVGIADGALPGQPAVYNVAFRTYAQEPVGLTNLFWHDSAQAVALARGDVSAFVLEVDWPDLAAGRTTPEPRPVGHTNRWYVSSIELGQGIGPDPLTHARPAFLGRVQPYAVNVPTTYDDAHLAPLTFLLHSLEMNLNQFATINSRFMRQVSEDRRSITVTPLGRGPNGWYFDEAELDFWEVWARVADDYNVDPDRTVVAGYSMGGYGAYKLGLSYPEAFAKAVVLAGPPRCGVRLFPRIGLPADINPHSHCAKAGETFGLLRNARWLPCVIAHGFLDQLVPITGVIFQVFELDRLGYRYRFELYPEEDHLGYAVKDAFASPAAHMGTGLRQGDPGYITFAWYPGLRRDDLGIGPRQVWWIADLDARDSGEGRLAEVDARSLARPDPAVTTDFDGSLVFGDDFIPGFAAEQKWVLGETPTRLPELGLRLRNTAHLSIDVRRAGFLPGEAGNIQAATDGPTGVLLRNLASATPVFLDNVAVGVSGVDGTIEVNVPKGHHDVHFG